MNESALIIFVVMFLVFLVISIFSSVKGKQDFHRDKHSSYPEDSSNVIVLSSLQDKLKKHIVNNSKERSLKVDGVLYMIASESIYSKCMHVSFNAFQVLQRIPLVYSMMLDAFINNDQNRLHYFLSNSLFERKRKILDEFKERDETYHCDIVCFEKFVLEDFTVIDRVSRVYSIDVLLNLQVCRYIKDNKGSIIKGCDNFIEDISEKWKCRSLGIRSMLSKKYSSWIIDSMERVKIS